jgi:hypothetical protein
MKTIDRDNCRLLLVAFIEDNDLPVRKVAKAIGCSEATLKRIILRKTLPTDEFMKQSGLMMEIGFADYSKLSKAKKEKFSEAMGTVSGGALGFGTITAAVSSLGPVAGLSAAGITSGLGALGSVVGGGMVAGISITAAIPLAAGALGYGVIKLVKGVCEKYQIDQEKYDPFWERPLEFDEPTEGASSKEDKMGPMNENIHNDDRSSAKLKPQDINALVQDVTNHIPKPWPHDIIDQVFLSIEDNTNWMNWYEQLKLIHGIHSLNPRIARCVFDLSGFNKSGPVKKPKSNLIKTYKWLS